MKGLYLYGVCQSVKIKKLSGKDIGESIGGGNVFSVPYKDIEAIVSEVSLKEFGSEEIQRRATENLEWIKDKALMHEKVIETAMNSHGLIIPMKFGTIFKDRGSLSSSLKKDYLKFKGLLGNLQGKEERSVKVYVRSKLLENEIKKSSPIIQKKLKEIKSLPAGRQYFLEAELDDLAKAEARKLVEGYIPAFLERFKQFVEESKENKILGKELTGESDPMIFNWAFLVKKERVDGFQGEIQKLRAEYGKIGFTFESSGPWPPYNFV
ncbi:MAG: GvpL/GvpF family gas vesicle protein [Candidatus Yanofskybacteria bacterium]|nr:GvpL/GvpF family gas vesicle protein [Candidatus Yanofskybacteria bacterium]